MANFEELLEQLRNPGDDPLPDTIYDDLHGAHTSALEETQSTAQAKIEELSAGIEERDGNIQKLKADNWDLFQQIPKSGDGESDDGSVETEQDQTLDSLIKPKE